MESPWHPVPSLDAEAFRSLRRAAIFDCYKWDVQIEDTCTLSPAPIVLRAAVWAELSQMAERLAQETQVAEDELRQHPPLHAKLGLPRRLLNALAGAPKNPGPRVIRFDFHYTTEGWKISEANTDVPGGFNEASGLALAMQKLYPRLRPAGDPGRTLARAIHSRTQSGTTVALVHATAFTDDHQVMAYLARELHRFNVRAELVSPEHLRWEAGRAFISTDWYKGPVGLVFRFFPGEWLANLPRGCAWQNFFHAAATPMTNQATALLTQSKRFPLLWDELETPCPTWRQLLPETREIAEADWLRGKDWVLKPALGRVGDMVGVPGVTNSRDWKQICKAARARPHLWVAQRRFEALAMETERGAVFPCVGVYTIDGQAAGAYGRVARAPLIDQFAQDAAVLVAAEDGSEEPKAAPTTPSYATIN